MVRSKRKEKESLATDTLIGQGSEMTGKLKCEANLRIEGKFNGEIESTQDVTVGESAEARSNIYAREVIIAGKVYGDISATGKLTITPTGQMFGDVSSSSLIIMEGGALSGKSTMSPTVDNPLLDKSKVGSPRVLHTEVG
ncbi:bactofilin family protein [Paenibacillus sp. CMAA1364]